MNFERGRAKSYFKQFNPDQSNQTAQETDWTSKHTQEKHK